MEHIGTVYGEATTDGFSFIFSPKKLKDKELKNAFVVVEGDRYKHKVIGKVVEIVTDNPLLSPENLKFFVEEGIGSKVGDFLKSNRFVSYEAKCEVIGEFDDKNGEVRPLTKPVETGSKVYLISKELLESLFFSKESYQLFPGFIEQVKGARFSLDGDQILTMHCGVFGMTGMGKTTTTTTLLEELTFRGAKCIVFDPHGDYENLGILKEEFFKKLREELENCPKLRTLVENYRNYLSKKWENLENEIPDALKDVVKEEKERELQDDSICFRLAMFCSVLKKDVVEADNVERFIRQLKRFAEEYSFEKLRKEIPEVLLGRLIKLVVKGFPSIKLNDFFDKYFAMSLIESYSGEEFSEAQEGHYVEWLEELEGEIYQKGKEYRDENLLDFLLSKVNRLNDSKRSSKWPIKRQLEKAKRSLLSLKGSSLVSVDSLEVVREFSKKDGKLSFVSNIVFDLTEVSPETVQRALLYSVAYAGFHLHKSKELSFHRGDNPILFVIEEARVLIPHSGAEDIDHPATKFARNIVRRIATEGRKMGLGLLIISQKPSSVDPLPVSQCNTLILHRVINPEDLSFVKSVGEAISDEDVETLKTVEKGVSIVTGTALKLRKSLLVRFRNRLSEEGREHPKPLREIWKR
jgi:DNA helicase HerA-like ATPase